MAFESALIVAKLISSAKSTSEIPDLLRSYNKARYPRCLKLDGLTHKAMDYVILPDGNLQADRDRLLRDPKVVEGSDFALANDSMRDWLWNFDAGKLADELCR